MKIKKISVSNFKVLDEIEISPKMINVIVGRNNTGKSSFLQSIIFDFRPDELNEILRDNPSAIINYRNDSGNVKIIAEENRNQVVQEIHFRRSSNETVYENLRADVISFFKRVKGKTEYPQSKVVSEVFSKAISDRISSIDDSTIQDAIDDTLFSAKKLAKNVIEGSIEVERKEFLNSANFKGRSSHPHVDFIGGVRYSRLLIEILRKIIGKITGGKAEPDHSLMRYLLMRGEFGFGLDYNIHLSVKVRSKNKKVPITYIKDPYSFLEDLQNKGEADEKLAFEIESIIKSEKIIPNLLRFSFEELVYDVPGEAGKVSMDMMGDGFKTLISILSALKSAPRDSILLLEEPEVHLHPGYVRELVRYLISLSNDLKLQLFISTHSSDIIENLLSLEGLSERNRKYIESELLIVRMSKKADAVTVDELSYEDANESYKGLLMDLRGI